MIDRKEPFDNSNKNAETDRNDDTKITKNLSFQSQSLKNMPAIPSASFTTLIDLDISRNSLSELPDTIGNFEMLQYLNCSRNQIRILPQALGKLVHLRSLIALSNSLRTYHRSLPLSELAALRCLKKLDLRYNSKLRGPAFKALQEILPERVEIQVTLPSNTQNKQKHHACDRDATLLQSQLEPWSTPHLRKRLEKVFQEKTNPDTVHRPEIIQRLLTLYHKNVGPTRPILWFQGTPVDPGLCDLLSQELREWARCYSSCPRERPTINAQVYMILRSPAEFSQKDGPKALRAAKKREQNRSLWELAHRAMKSVDPDYAQQYTALAVTCNFVGSPHIDTQNSGPFYGMALGDFWDGGALCVELNPMAVAAVDTRHRLGKVDGRYPHWVSPYQGERFSLIFYQTLGGSVPMERAVYSEPCTIP